MAPLHSIDQENQIRCNRTFWLYDAIGASVHVMWCWYQCHVAPPTLSMAPLQSLGQVMLMPMASHDISTMASDTNASASASSGTKKLSITSKQSSQHAKGKGVIDGTISTM